MSSRAARMLGQGQALIESRIDCLEKRGDNFAHLIGDVERGLRSLVHVTLHGKPDTADTILERTAP